jgi:hypothetical protein
MRRREFITLIGGTAAAWPLVARAQQPERGRRIGVLMNTTADNTEGRAGISAFQQGLQDLGWAEGRNLRIEIRWGENDLDRSRQYAAELRAGACRSPRPRRLAGLFASLPRVAAERLGIIPRRSRLLASYSAFGC